MNPENSIDRPVPCQLERDDVGRIVYLTCAGNRPLPPESENAWLLAVDGSPRAEQAVTAFLALAGQFKSCRVHVANVQHWLSKEAAETELLDRGWQAAAGSVARIEESGLPWQLHLTMGDAAPSIAALASRLGCRGIVIGNRGLGTAESLLMGSVTRALIGLAPVPVLVVP